MYHIRSGGGGGEGYSNTSNRLMLREQPNAKILGKFLFSMPGSLWKLDGEHTVLFESKRYNSKSSHKRN